MFEREHEVVSALAAQHRRLWPAARMRVVKAERGYGRGVPDLVVLDFNPQALRERLWSALAPVDVSLSYFVGALRRAGSVRVDQKDQVDPAVSARTNRRAIAALTESGHVIESDGLLALHGAMRPTLARVVAVEAKLSDWRGGLLQASRYAAFADQSYLAIPARVAHRLTPEQREAMRVLGVGLIAVGEAAAQVLVAAPRRRPLEVGVRAWVEESELADLAGSPRRLVAPFRPRFSVPSPEELVAPAR